MKTLYHLEGNQKACDQNNVENIDKDLIVNNWEIPTEEFTIQAIKRYSACLNHILDIKGISAGELTTADIRASLVMFSDPRTTYIYKQNKEQ